MPIQQIKQELEDTEALRIVTESLSEVAALKFKTTRSQIQHNKIFFKNISRVYHALQILAEKRRLRKAQPRVKNGKTVSLLITSNYPLYGGLDSKLSYAFRDAIKSYPTDKIVIGSTGSSLLEALDPDGGYQSFIMGTDTPTAMELRNLLDMVKDYSQVFVFHSKFVTILNQAVDVTELTNRNLEKEAQTSQIHYIVEPELDKMIEFFESQILSSILVSIFLQAELSRTASRMIAMDQAELNTEKLINKQTLNVLRSKSKIQDLRILEIYSTIKRINVHE